jgi:hypothetical protein
MAGRVNAERLKQQLAPRRVTKKKALGTATKKKKARTTKKKKASEEQYQEEQYQELLRQKAARLTATATGAMTKFAAEIKKNPGITIDSGDAVLGFLKNEADVRAFTKHMHAMDDLVGTYRSPKDVDFDQFSIKCVTFNDEVAAKLMANKDLREDLEAAFMMVFEGPPEASEREFGNPDFDVLNALVIKMCAAHYDVDGLGYCAFDQDDEAVNPHRVQAIYIESTLIGSKASFGFIKWLAALLKSKTIGVVVINDTAPAALKKAVADNARRFPPCFINCAALSTRFPDVPDMWKLPDDLRARLRKREVDGQKAWHKYAPAPVTIRKIMIDYGMPQPSAASQAQTSVGMHWLWQDNALEDVAADAESDEIVINAMSENKTESDVAEDEGAMSESDDAKDEDAMSESDDAKDEDAMSESDDAKDEDAMSESDDAKDEVY